MSNIRPQIPKADTCKECPRYTDSRCTPTTVNGGVDILFVCDQPDLLSASNNAPLMGHSGRVVHTAIRAVMESSAEYKQLRTRFTYAVQCIDKKETPAPRLAVEKCKTFLENTIKAVPPKLIVAMGASALKQLSIKDPFSDWRGRVIENSKFQIPIFVTFSDKALLAQPGLFSTFKLDVKNIFDKVLDKRETASLEELSKNYILPKTVEEVKDTCKLIVDYTERGHPAEWAISLDTETTTLHPEKDSAKVIAFCIGWGVGRATTILFDHPHAPPEYLARLDEVKAALMTVLASAKPKIFHNAKFDLKFIEQRYGMAVNNVMWDTLLGEHLLDEDKKGNYGLKVLTSGWLPKYCGYEDKLYDLLHTKEQATSSEAIDIKIRDLALVLTPDQRVYLDSLAEYKVKKAAYESAMQEYRPKLVAYEAASVAYARDKAAHEMRVRTWEISDNKTRGRKPVRSFVKPKKPARPVSPAEPKDPRTKKEKQVQTDAGFETLPIADLCLYGAVDADVTRQLAKIQLTRIQSEKSRVSGLMQSHGIPISRVLGRAEYQGTRIDRDYIEVLNEGLTKTIEDCEVELYKMAGTTQPSGKELNIASGQQIGNVLYNWGWMHPDGTKMDPYPVKDRTAQGLPSTADKTLKQFLAYEDKDKEIPTKEAYFIERYGKWKKAKKAKETFLTNISVLSRRDGFLHTNFHINGTGTGRLSSSDMNLQNIPKYLGGWNIKKLFIPSNDELLFVNCDYKGAEVRVFTAYAKDAGLIDAINNGLDMHCYFAAKVFGRPYEHYENRDNADSGLDAQYRKLLDKERSQIKRVVFGILYGAGPGKIAETVGVTEDVARELIQMLYDMFEAIKQYGIDVEQEVRDHGFVDTLLGRRRRFPLKGLSRHQSRAFRQAKNFKIQSTSSDIVLGQLVELDVPLRNEFKGRILLTVHDSIGFEFPKKYVHQLKDFVTYYGQQRVQQKYHWLPVEFKLDIEVGPSYGEVQPLDKYLKQHPFVPEPEGILEESELLDELREDAFLATGS